MTILYFFLQLGPTILHKKFHVIWSKIDDFIHSSGIIFIILFLATREVVGPLANDPIISGRLIRLLRHIEHQNPSIISDSIGCLRRINTTIYIFQIL